MRFQEEFQAWSERSLRGEVCGFMDCPDAPTKRCRRCRLHYCPVHIKVHRHYISPLLGRLNLLTHMFYDKTEPPID